MMKKLIVLLALVATQAQAETPWARDCVKWWGGDIPLEERTKANCPQGFNHWDRGGTGSALVAGDNFYGGPTGTSVQTYNLPNGSYMVQRSGSTTTVIQTSKSR